MIRPICTPLVTLAALAALSACASSPKAMTKARKDDAVGKCFSDFENYPSQRDACLSRVRTAPDAE